MLYRLTTNVQDKPSPNFAPGRGGAAVRAIVIHKSEGSLASCISWFETPSSQVSAHYVIGLDGSVTNMVNPDDTAWHSGVVVDPTADSYVDGTNPNAYTVGIELEGFAANGTPTKQIAALVDLLIDLCLYFHLSPDPYTIAYHRDYDKAKTCPGPWLDRNSLIMLTQAQLSTAFASKLPVPPAA